MLVSKTLVVLAAALTASATKVHNQFGLNFWIQDNAGNDHYVSDGGSVTINGGWGFFWTNDFSHINCHQQNSASFWWPAGYGDVYLKSSGHLVDAGGSQQGESARINLSCS